MTVGLNTVDRIIGEKSSGEPWTIQTLARIQRRAHLES